MLQRRSDIWIGIGLLAFCLFAAVYTARIPAVATGTSVGPNFIPWAMIGMIVLMTLALVVRSMLDARGPTPAEATSPQDPAEVDDTALSSGAALRIGIFVVLLIVYAAFFTSLGYLVTTTVVFVSGMALLGERSLVNLIVAPVIVTTIVFYSFTELLQVWLP